MRPMSIPIMMKVFMIPTTKQPITIRHLATMGGQRLGRTKIVSIIGPFSMTFLRALLSVFHALMGLFITIHPHGTISQGIMIGITLTLQRGTVQIVMRRLGMGQMRETGI